MMAAAEADAELVARCQDGDEAAWAALVERFSRYVFAISQGYRLSEPDAEDVFQEVFTRAYERLGELRDPGAVKAWLAQMTRRLCVDRLRVGTREAPTGFLPEAEAEDAVAQLGEALAIQDALATLPDNCQEIVDRFFARDQSYRTISEALDVPQGTIASRISRCLAQLRVELAEG